MTPQELKNSILQLAIQGKLVEQRPEEGTAEELYQQIQQEKQKLIKEGKIKKEKPLPEISEEEKPFDIPESWKWVTLGSIGETNIGLTYSPNNVTSNGTIVLRSSNIQNGIMDYQDIVRVNIDVPESKRCHKGDILICARNGSKKLVGKSAIIDAEGMSFGAFMAVFRSKCNEYILHVINSMFFRNALLGDTGTTTINQITQDMLKSAFIPLPPLAEQKRIVAKVEELLPLIDRYEKAWSRLEEFNKRFPDDLQKSILQMAIQGKLVEQRPEEGTGEELYIDIKRRKTIIESTGVLKGRKKKELIPIDENDTPFDIPSSWRWIRLGEVSEIFGRIGFRGYTKNDIVDKGKGAITISPSNLLPNGCTDFSECTYISWEKYEESPEIKIYEDDILIVKTGSSYGKCCLVKSLPEKATINPQLAVLKYTLCDCPYLAYALSSPMARKQFEVFVIGTSIPTFSQEKLSNLLIPLPPLAEQRRIVAKIEELLPLCDRLKK